jgi:hypothetical protein
LREPSALKDDIVSSCVETSYVEIKSTIVTIPSSIA